MKNASYHHVVQAQPNSGYMLPTNVMFLVAVNNNNEKIKAHIKGAIYDLEWGRKVLLMENESGVQFIGKAEWLSPVPRKMGTPAKPKRKPLKGSKPWLANYVTYDPSLIKAGTKVLCRDGEVRVVEGFASNHKIIIFPKDDAVWLHNGRRYVENYTDNVDIMKVFVHPTDKKPTTVEQYNGYEVGKWHFWQGGEQPVANDVLVSYWMRGDAQQWDHNDPVGRLHWDWEGTESDIIAFYIPEEQQ